MRVLYDHRIFEAQEYGGISRYFAELVRRNPEARVSLEYSDNVHIRELPGFAEGLRERDYAKNRFLAGLRFRGKSRVFSLFEKATGSRHRTNEDASIEALEGGDYDVFHPTYYDPYFLDRLGGKPFVLTIYDMIHERYPELFNIGDSTGAAKKRIALKAGRIIAISENTKNDIVRHYGIERDRISVIYLASSLARGGKRRLGLPERYILYTGTRDGYKNFRFFAAAIAELLIKSPGLSLVCSGPRFSRDELSFLAMLGIADKVLHVFAAEDELFQLYGRAACFVFPSYYEGFGIPVLEAFEAGCPTLLARSSCLPEIGGDAALYFDPKDRTELLASLGEILGSEALRGELRAKAYERAASFTWDETYRRTIECYAGIGV